MFESQLRSVFARHTSPAAADVVAIVDALLLLAVERKHFELRCGAAGNTLLVTSGNATCTIDLPFPLLRAVIARLAWLSARENSDAFQPYGGKTVFEYGDHNERCKLRVEYENTSARSWIRVTVP